MNRKPFIWLSLLLALLCAGALFLYGRTMTNVHRLKDENEALQMDVGSAQVFKMEYDSLTESHHALQESYVQAQNELARCQAESQSLTDENAALRSGVSEGLRSNRTLTDELERRQAETQQLQNELTDTQEQVDAYREQYDNLQQYVVSLESMLESYAADPGAEERLSVISDLQARLAISETKSDDQQKTIADLEEKLTAAELAYAGASALLQESGQNTLSAAEELESLREESVRLQEELTRCQTDLAGQTVLLTEARDAVLSKEADIRILQSQNAELSEHVASYDEDKRNADTREEELLSEIEHLQQLLTESEQYASGRDALLSESQAQSAQQEAAISHLRTQMESMYSAEELAVYMEQIAQYQAMAAYSPISILDEADLREQVERLTLWRDALIDWLMQLRTSYAIEQLLPYTDPDSGETIDPILAEPTPTPDVQTTN